MVNSRDKGRRGEGTAIYLLTSRDYTIVADTTAGKASCDLLAEKCGITFAVDGEEPRAHRHAGVPRSGEEAGAW